MINNMNDNMKISEDLNQLAKQIRLSYAHLLKMHIQYCNRYKNIKNRVKDEELIKDLQQIEQFFYKENGKINWETIYPLMPPDIEKRIKKEYGALNENEIKLCCLLLFNVPCKDITEILSYTQKSIHSITHRIKQKTGMKKIQENLKKFLL
jgi:DNA-binding CsgD family transcriptional regulator